MNAGAPAFRAFLSCFIEFVSGFSRFGFRVSEFGLRESLPRSGWVCDFDLHGSLAVEKIDPRLSMELKAVFCLASGGASIFEKLFSLKRAMLQVGHAQCRPVFFRQCARSPASSTYWCKRGLDV